MSLLRAAMAAALLPAILCAQDEDQGDTRHHLRLSAHLLPTHYSSTNDNPTTGPVSGGGDFSDFMRVRGAYLAEIPFSRDAAFLIGVNGVVSNLESGEGASDIQQTGIGIEVGVAATPARNLAFEFVAQGGFGLADGDAIDDGHYGEFGLAMRPVLRLAFIELFGEIGYLSQWQKSEQGDTNSDVRVTGAQFALGGGLVF